MSKTVFEDTVDPTTIVSAAFLNAMNNHRHMGTNTDGDGAIDYAADTGAANAYLVALTPALPALVIGMPVRFKAGNANTGASTLNVNGLGAVAIKKMVNMAIVAGDILAGEMVEVIYDGTYFQLMAPSGIILTSQIGNPWYKVWADKTTASGLFIAQGGVVNAISGGSGVSISLPLTFPTAYLTAIAGAQATGGYGGALAGGIRIDSLSGVTVFNNGASSPNAIAWRIEGY